MTIEIAALILVSLAFAGGAMLAVVALELGPDAFARKVWRKRVLGALARALIMLALTVALGV